MTAEFLTQRRKAVKTQRVFSVLTFWRLGAFALKGPFYPWNPRNPWFKSLGCALPRCGFAPIPVPLVFGKGQFESGVAAKVLREFAQDPFPYLDEAEKKNMIAAHSALLGKFTELAFDESAEARWQESRPMEADNMDVGPATETDLQGDLIEASGNPF
jgi:hypothetical protein